MSGPTYETRAEAAFLASAGGKGASVVGMSTVPEVVVARDEGLRVLVLSLVTNLVIGAEGAGAGAGLSVREEFDAEVRFFFSIFFFLFHGGGVGAIVVFFVL